MTYARIRPAIAKLRSDGIEIASTSNMTQVRKAVESLTGQLKAPDESQPDCLGRYLRGFTQSTKVQPYQRVWKAIKPENVKPHWRLADINRDQPPFMTPRGAVGNGDEHSKLWRR